MQVFFKYPSVGKADFMTRKPCCWVSISTKRAQGVTLMVFFDKEKVAAKKDGNRGRGAAQPRNALPGW